MRWIIIVCVMLNAGVSVAAVEKSHFAAPVMLPGTQRDMKSPGFWISRHPSPDAVILSAQEIKRFNQQLSKAGLTKDLDGIDAFDLNIGKSQIQKEIQKFERGDYFDYEGQLVSRELFKRIKENVMIDDMSDIVLRHAFVLRQSDQRLLPASDLLTAEPFDFEFDEVQNSSLDAGEPVVIFYETLDKKWAYTQTMASAGWIKTEDLLFVSSDEFKNLLTLENFVVVTSAKADLFFDAGRKKFYDYVRMGAKFAVNAMTAEMVEVAIAPGQSAFINRADVHRGFLPYTPRIIIEQAFKMLNEPYGWGGMNGEQDCSAFLKSIFATVGMSLPRNSAEQGKVGKDPAASSKSNARGSLEILAKSLPGITVAQMKGHIVLYLGMIQDRPFAIHEAYAYRERGDSAAGEDRVCVFNRVAVSGLDLGQSSKKGSLLERIVSIREYR